MHHAFMCMCMHVCVHAWMHLVCAQECRCIYISFASVWIHVPLQVCYMPVMYLCAVHFDTFCLLCPVSYLKHACCYFAFPCNRCNKEHFELELELEHVPHINKATIISHNILCIQSGMNCCFCLMFGPNSSQIKFEFLTKNQNLT